LPTAAARDTIPVSPVTARLKPDKHNRRWAMLEFEIFLCKNSNRMEQLGRSRCTVTFSQCLWRWFYFFFQLGVFLFVYLSFSRIQNVPLFSQQMLPLFFFKENKNKNKKQTQEQDWDFKNK
jgi:hypothetical protein